MKRYVMHLFIAFKPLLFFVASMQTQKAHQLTQFHITNWNSSGKCENFKAVTDVNEEVIKVQRRTGNNPVLVHCKYVRALLPYMDII